MKSSDGSTLRAPSRDAPRPSSIWARPTRILVVVGIVIVVGLGLRWATGGSEADGQALFRTAPAEQRKIVQTVEATGRLQPRHRNLVVAPVEGRLAEVAVQPGEGVEKGQLLARLDARSLAFEVRRAEAGVAAARGALSEAKAAEVEADQQVVRARRLAGRGQLSQADLQAAVAQAERAKAATQVASAKLNEAQATLRAALFAAEQTDIVASRDGVVLTVPREIGRAVSPAGPVLFTISAPLEVLRLEASVGEADIGSLAVGQPAEFEVQAYPQKKFSATVEAIGVVANNRQGVATYTVELSAPNPEGRLLPGMSSAVRFEVARTDHVLAVREGALRFSPIDAPEAPPRSRVFKVHEDGRVESVPVKVGISDGVWVEVEVEPPAILERGDTVAIGYLTEARGATPGLKIGG